MQAIPGMTSAFAKANGLKLHYWIGGNPEGPPVLLWHGFLGTAYSWREVAPALMHAGYHVLVHDMRGYGDSDKPAGTEGYDARALAQECMTLVTAIGFGQERPIILVAHDMGALPALLWAADWPDRTAALLYIEAPLMLADVLRNTFDYMGPAMRQGSMWWWMLPLAPGIPERLIVGKEREFLTWFYHGAHVARPEAFPETVVDEYLRTFAGSTGVLGSMGIYRAAFKSVEQTEALRSCKLQVPVIAIGGERGLGDKVGLALPLVAHDVRSTTLTDCGHFVPEERPEAIVQHVLRLSRS